MYLDELMKSLQHVLALRPKLLVCSHAGVIEDACFKTYGCGSAIASSSLVTEWVKGKTLDEAAQLKPKIWESYLSQRLIDKRGWAFLISTPKGKGWFYDMFRRGQSDDPDHESWNYSSFSNPHLDAELIEKERERLPERVFRQEYGGQFIEGAG